MGLLTLRHPGGQVHVLRLVAYLLAWLHGLQLRKLLGSDGGAPDTLAHQRVPAHGATHPVAAATALVEVRGDLHHRAAQGLSFASEFVDRSSTRSTADVTS